LKIIESEQFKKELRLIAHHIKKDKVDASVKFVKNLKTTMNDLIDSPYKFRKSIYFDDIEVRDMIYYGYTVIYEIKKEKDLLEILTIFNQNLPDLDS
jgi:plasmid stabilization system protein ParE